MAYKYKLSEMSKTASPEAAAKELERKDGEGFQVGQVTYAADGQSKSTITNIDSETGAVSWKITQLPGFDKLYDEMDQLVDVAKRVYVKTKDDAKFREIYDEARKLRNKVRTHLRNEYPDEYKRMTRIGEAYSGFLRNPEDPDSEKFEPTGSVAQFKEDLRALFGKFKGDLKNPEFIKGVAQIMVNWKSLLRSQMDESKYDKEETIQQTIDRLKARIEDPNDGGNVPFLVQKIKDLEKSLSEATEYKGRKLSHEEEDRLDLIAHKEFNCDFKDCSDEDKSKIGNKRNLVGVNEAKKKKEKKDPPIGKPKRGGSKAYYVYVRDPKTKKVKKVSFGSGGLRAKIRNPKARKAFAARHNCKNKKDRTKAGYWSCNLPRYASQLGLGANMNTFW